MSKNTDREGEVLALVVAGADEKGECELDLEQLPTMSRRTFFRVYQSLEEKGLLQNVEGTVYRLLLPPTAFKKMRWLVESAKEMAEIQWRMRRLQQKFLPGVVSSLEEQAHLCARCENIADCFSGKVSQCQMAPVPNGTLISYEEGGSGREEMPVPNGTGDSGPIERSRNEPPRPSARDILRRGLEDSRTAAVSKPATMRAQLRDLKEVWDAELKQVHGDDFRPPRWGGKENKSFPSIIKNYGLELTKRAVLLYFREWSNIKAENVWIDAATPTTGLFLYFQDRLFAAAQGRGQVVGERASKRTADEPDYEAEDGQSIGEWPKEEAPHEA